MSQVVFLVKVVCMMRFYKSSVEIKSLLFPGSVFICLLFPEPSLRHHFIAMMYYGLEDSTSVGLVFVLVSIIKKNTGKI